MKLVGLPVPRLPMAVTINSPTGMGATIDVNGWAAERAKEAVAEFLATAPREAAARHASPAVGGPEVPIDRILLAQAMVEGITLLTSDPVVARYPGSVREV